MKMQNLKRCPFCGGNGRFSYGFGYEIYCEECGSRGNTYPSKEQAILRWNNRLSPWHTGTPTEDGMYICKVFYGDIPNDIRILEWVGAMDCFCLPNSNTRIYHFFVGKNGGKEPEVVYEWLKLDLRFRMEKKWIEPTPIHLNSNIRGTLEDCIKAAKLNKKD